MNLSRQCPAGVHSSCQGAQRHVTAEGTGGIGEYLPTARLEAVVALRAVSDEGEDPIKVADARKNLDYITNMRGPEYQARLIEQMGVRDIKAVITREQTPLKRVKELGAAIGAEISQRNPEQVARVVQSLDQPTKVEGPGDPNPAIRGRSRFTAKSANVVGAGKLPPRRSAIADHALLLLRIEPRYSM